MIIDIFSGHSSSKDYRTRKSKSTRELCKRYLVVFPELKLANQKSPKDILIKKTSTKKFNKHLKSIAKKAEIDKKMTMHCNVGNEVGKNRNNKTLTYSMIGFYYLILRCLADSNRCTWFCKPLPSHSAKTPYSLRVCKFNQIYKYYKYFLCFDFPRWVYSVFSTIK